MPKPGLAFQAGEAEQNGKCKCTAEFTTATTLRVYEAAKKSWGAISNRCWDEGTRL